MSRNVRTSRRKIAGKSPKARPGKGRKATARAGYHAAIMVRQQVGRREDRHGAVLDLMKPVGARADSSKAVGKAVRRALGRQSWERAAKTFSAGASPVRLKILAELLIAGRVGHAELARITRLQAGPLYHHLDRLRLAGLIRTEGRNRYALSRGGRNFLLLAKLVGRAATDGRNCPAWS